MLPSGWMERVSMSVSVACCGLPAAERSMPNIFPSRNVAAVARTQSVAISVNRRAVNGDFCIVFLFGFKKSAGNAADTVADCREYQLVTRLSLNEE